MNRHILSLLTSIVSISSALYAETTFLSDEVSTLTKDLLLEAPLHILSGSHFHLANLELTSSASPIHTEAGSSLMLLGVVSGKGDFIKDGQGTVHLMGSEPNMFEGKTIVNSGLLVLNKVHGPALASDILINAGKVAIVTPGQLGEKAKITLVHGSLDLQENSLTLDTLYFQGGKVLQKAPITLNTLDAQGVVVQGDFKVNDAILFDPSIGGTALIEGTLDLGEGVRPIVVPKGKNPIDMNIAASITSGGIAKRGSGSLQLSGVNTYIGPTHVHSGVMALSGVLEHSQVTVHVGARLEGSGKAASIRNRGTMQPNHLIVTGPFIQESMGVAHFQLRDRTNFDQLIVQNGEVTLAGTALVEFLPTFTIDQNDKLLLIDNTEGSGINGTFEQLLVQNIPAGYSAHLDYLAQSVYLLFDPLASSAPIIMPTCYVSLAPVLFASADERLTSYTRKMTALRNHKQEGIQLYADGIGSLGRQKKAGDARSLHYSSGGARMGVDYTNARGVIGAAVTYEATSSHHHDHCASYRFDGVYGDIYGTISPNSLPELFVEADLGGGLQFYDIYRHTAGGTAKGRPHGSSYNFLVDLGYQYRGKAVYFVPSAGLEWLGAHVNHYSEHRAGTSNLELHKQNAQAFRSNVSATLGYRFSHKEWQIIPELRGIWRHDFAKQHRRVGFELESTDATSHFNLEGAGRNSGLVGAQLMFLGTQFQFHGSYDYQFSRRIYTHFLEVGLGWHF